MSEIGQNVVEIVSVLNVESLEKIIDQDVFSTLESFVEEENFEDTLRDVATKLIYGDPIKYFSNPDIRGLFYKAMTEGKISSLAERLDLNSVDDVYILDPSINKNVFDRYLGFFGIDNRLTETTMESEHENVKAKFGLFEHQRDAVKKVWEIVGGGHGKVMLHMPTGSGKTRTTMHLISKYLNTYEPGVVVWLASSKELLEQAAEVFKNAWESLGTRNVQIARMWGQYQPNLNEIKDGLVVAGLQKMHLYCTNGYQSLSFAPRVKLVVVDEAHQSIAPTYRQTINQLVNTGMNCALIGLTATPGRTWSDISSDEELSTFFNKKKIILEIPGWRNPVSYLIENGYLAKPTFRQIHHQSSEECSQNDSEGDYAPEIVAKLEKDKSRNVLIIKEVKKLIDEGHKRIIMFAASVKHAEVLSTVLSALDIDAKLITSETPLQKREQTIKSFRRLNNNPIVACNFGVLTTGFDAPQTSAAVIARPTRSLVLFSQMVGRAMRGEHAGGNRQCTISTIIDTALPGFGSVVQAFTNWEDVW